MNTSVTELCLQSECFGGLESREITQGGVGSGGLRWIVFSPSLILI